MRTFIPKPPPIDRRITLSGVVKFVHERHQFVQNDLEKTGDIMDHEYYQGYVDALDEVTKFICVKRKEK